MSLNIRSFIQNNIAVVATFIFLVLFILFNMAQPSFAYTKQGHIRVFGLNYKHKTIFPVWLIAIVLAITIYFFINYFIVYPRINFKRF